MKIFFMAIFLLGAISMNAEAKVLLTKVDYKSEDKVFEGIIAYDSSIKGEMPGIVVFHNWLGITEETESKIKELALLGYVVMAGDIYGKGIRPKDAKTAGEISSKYKNDRKLLRSRVNLALDELKRNPHVDRNKLFAIGYCFGGMAALELARSGAPLLGTVTFHGALSSPTPVDAKNIKGQVAAFHGALDPFVKADEVAAFKKELDDAKVIYQLTLYSGAVHSFTDKSAGSDISKGQAYNELADKRSWEAMKDFFAELSK